MGGGGDAAVLGYGGEGRRGVSYLLSGHELETYIHTYFIIFPERAFQRQYAWDVSTWDVNQTEGRGGGKTIEMCWWRWWWRW